MSTARRSPTPWAAFARLAAVVSLVGVQIALLAGPASAHGGNAVFDVETDVSGTDVTLDVGITYDTDGEPARGALVEAVGAGPSDARSGRFTLGRDAAGRYVGSTTVPVPGTWRFTIESSFPPGSTDVTIDVHEAGGDGSGSVPRRILLLVAVGAFAAGAVAISAGRRRRRRRRTGHPGGW